MQRAINKAGVRVLVVEDEQVQREVLGDILTDQGYAVELAAGGDEAVRRLAEKGFPVVLTDLKMPGADGHEVLRAALAADENAVVVLLTAYATVDSAVRAMKQGAVDYLSKPINKDELLIVLEKALANRALARENQALHRQLEDRYHFDKIIGASPAMHEIYRLIGKVLHNDSTVLVSGESRHRQGAGGPGDPLQRRSASGPVCRGQLRGDPREPDRERAVRPRERRVLRGRRPPHRQVRIRRGRHPVPGRDLHPAVRPAGQAAAGAPGKRVPARWAATACSGPMPGLSPPPTRSCARWWPGELSAPTCSTG